MLTTVVISLVVLLIISLAGAAYRRRRPGVDRSPRRTPNSDVTAPPREPAAPRREDRPPEALL